MADKDKPRAMQPKNIPKDGQVIMAMMKEMGITECEPKTLVQLTEFVYRYATSILEEARMYANNSKKKFLDVDDVRLALKLTSESTFATPPPREVVLECAHAKNYTPLPPVKPHCGLRLPPDRHCLASCNYMLKSGALKKGGGKPSYATGGGGAMKIGGKPNVSYIKRPSAMGGVVKQTVSIPKPVTKIAGGPASGTLPKTVVKPKIHITPHNMQGGSSAANGGGGTPMDVDGTLKRKREDDSDLM